METKDIIAEAALLLTVINLLWTRYIGGQDKSKAAVDAVKEEMTKAETRITQMEMVMKSLPTKDAFHQLEISVTELRGESKAQGKDLTAITATTLRIEKWLMETNAPRTKAR